MFCVSVNEPPVVKTTPKYVNLLSIFNIVFSYVNSKFLDNESLLLYFSVFSVFKFSSLGV